MLILIAPKKRLGGAERNAKSHKSLGSYPKNRYSLEQALVVGIVGIVGMVGMVGIVGINK